MSLPLGRYGQSTYGNCAYGTMSNASNIGITPNDFSKNALVDLGVTVPYSSVTQVLSNLGEDETLTYASAVDKTVVFIKNNQRYEQVVGGLVDLGDARMFTPADFKPAKNDKIVYDAEEYLVDRVIARRVNGELLFYTANLVKTE
jgi:hypothetical protein